MQHDSVSTSIIYCSELMTQRSSARISIHPLGIAQEFSMNPLMHALKHLVCGEYTSSRQHPDCECLLFAVRQHAFGPAVTTAIVCVNSDGIEGLASQRETE
jgi:hypothetical protein